MTASMIYLIYVLGSLGAGASITAIFCLLFILVTTVILLAVWEDREEDWVPTYKSYIMSAVKLLVISLVVATIIPDTKTATLMLITSEVSQIEDVETLPINTVKALNKLLEDYINKETTNGD